MFSKEYRPHQKSHTQKREQVPPYFSRKLGHAYLHSLRLTYDPNSSHEIISIMKHIKEVLKKDKTNKKLSQQQQAKQAGRIF